MTIVPDPEGWKQMLAFANRCQPTITKYTVCIYVWQERNRKLAVAGTGVLLRVADRSFMLSAAHVMDLTFNHKMPFAAHVGSGAEKPIPLAFIARKSSDPPPDISHGDPDLRDGDPLDISIAELTPETAQRLAARYRFLTLNDFDPFPVQKADEMLVFGYPAALSQPGDGDIELENWPLSYFTQPLQIPPEPRDEDKEILVRYDRSSADSEGNATEVPHPAGFSGCGIWRLFRPPIDPALARVEDIRLVGIQHRWRPKSHYIVGTSVRHFFDMLWGCYPDLRPVLGMWRKQ